MDISTLVGTVGGVIGAIAGGFAVYDRLFRNHLVLDFVVKAPDIFLSIPTSVFLKIRNRADTDILRPPGPRLIRATPRRDQWRT